jgi:hypothetical protein
MRRASVGVSHYSGVDWAIQEQTGRGDTSGWTDTPETRAERLRLGGPSTLALPSAASAAEAKRASQVANMVDSYNTKKRAKSLLEQHLEVDPA